MGILNNIKVAAKNRTTYRVGLLQSKAYRILKHHTTQGLAEFQINSLHWAFLGILYDQNDGLRLIAIAEELGVEAPFVTTMYKELETRNFLESKPDTSDSRAKIICLTKEGRDFVSKTERHLREVMKPLLKDIPLKELMAYLVVLEKIIENDTK